MGRVRNGEQGSEVVQFVVTVPLLLFVVFATMQVGGMMLVVGQASSDITQACREIDLGGLARAADKEAFVEEAILGAATQLVPENLQVGGVRTANELAEVTESPNGEGVFEQRTSKTRVAYDVRYDLPSFLGAPGLSGQTLSRHVECTLVAGRVIEAAWSDG